MDGLVETTQSPYVGGTAVSPILQMSKLRLREVKSLIYKAHTPRECNSRDVSPRSQCPHPQVLPCLPSLGSVLWGTITGLCTGGHRIWFSLKDPGLPSPSVPLTQFLTHSASRSDSGAGHLAPVSAIALSPLLRLVPLHPPLPPQAQCSPAAPTPGPVGSLLSLGPSVAQKDAGKGNVCPEGGHCHPRPAQPSPPLAAERGLRLLLFPSRERVG